MKFKLWSDPAHRRRTLLVLGIAALGAPLILMGVLLLGTADVDPDGVPLPHVLEPVRGKAPSEQASQGFDLLGLIRTEADAVTDGWGFYRGALFSPASNWSRLQIPCAFPEEYDLTLTVVRKRGWEALVLGLPVEGRLAVVVIDGARGQKCWLELATAEDPADNDTAVEGKRLRWNERAIVRCVVRKGSIEVSINDSNLFSWKGDPRDLTLRSAWRVPDVKMPFLGAQGSIFMIESMTLLAITGSPVPARPA